MTSIYRICVWSIAIVALASCGSYLEVIDSGQVAFDRKQYVKAAELYEKEYYESEAGIEKAQKAYYIGLSLQKANMSAEASSWFAKAVKEGYGPSALREWAYSLKFNERYKEAAQAFGELVETVRDNSRYKTEQRVCQTAAQWKAEINANPYKLSSLDLNTGYSEFSNSMTADGKLIFTSDRPRNRTSDKYNWTGNYYSDLYLFDPAVEDMMPIDAVLNQKFNEGAAVMSSDGQLLIFTRCGEDLKDESFCYLYSSNYEDDRWSAPQKLPFQIELANYSHPTLSESGDVLIFSSNMSLSEGSYDIFYSELSETGSWSEANSISAVINTEYDELSPFLDGDTLYFSSDGHFGMGGLDVFKSHLDENRKWSSPDNLRAPINSGEDDLGFVFLPSSPEQGFVSSNRSSGRGGDDIYSWKRQDISTPPLVTKPDSVSEAEIEYTLLISVFVKSPVYSDRTDPSSFTGEYRGLKNALVLTDTKTIATNPNGVALFDADWDRTYRFSATKKGYFKSEIEFDPSSLVKDPVEPNVTVNLVITLDRVFVGQEIALDNIYYDLAKWDIRPDARPALDSLIDILRLNPDIAIELSSHTDCRGEDDYNLDLSQKRAESAVDYMVEAGIDIARLSPKGYGETKARANCLCDQCDEVQHQYNRRTSFTVKE